MEYDGFDEVTVVFLFLIDRGLKYVVHLLITLTTLK